MADREGTRVSLALAFLRANWLLALLAALLAVQTVRIEGLKIWPLKIDGLKAELQSEKDGRKADREAYAAAQREAKAKNEQQVARIVADQEKVNDEIKPRYKADRERMRAELDKRLRSKAPQGSTGRSEASPDGSPPGRIDEAAPVCIPTSQYVQGAETELQLDALIDWIERQLQVER